MTVPLPRFAFTLSKLNSTQLASTCSNGANGKSQQSAWKGNAGDFALDLSDDYTDTVEDDDGCDKDDDNSINYDKDDDDD